MTLQASFICQFILQVKNSTSAQRCSRRYAGGMGLLGGHIERWDMFSKQSSLMRDSLSLLQSAKLWHSEICKFWPCTGIRLGFTVVLLVSSTNWLAMEIGFYGEHPLLCIACTWTEGAASLHVLLSCMCIPSIIIMIGTPCFVWGQAFRAEHCVLLIGWITMVKPAFQCDASTAPYHCHCVLQLASIDRIIQKLQAVLMEEANGTFLSDDQKDAVAVRICQLSMQRTLVQFPQDNVGDVTNLVPNMQAC